MSNLKNNIKRIIGYVFRFLCIHARLLDGKSFIFMYHRVCDNTDDKELYDSAMFVSAKSLEMHIRELSRVFNITVDDEITAGINVEKPYCILTFDDGWLDNLIYAYPVLKSMETPAIIFITVNYIGTNTSFWFHHIWHIASVCKRKQRSHDFFSYFNKYITTNQDVINEDNVAYIVGQLKNLSSEKVDAIVGGAYQALDIVPYADQTILNWDQVKELSSNGITIGSHGLSHYILTTVGADLKEKEITDSIAIVRNNIDKPSRLFCYPNGNYDEETIDIVRRAGYIGAIGTEIGYNITATNKYCLKRIALHEHIASSPGLLWFRIFQGYMNGSR